MNVPANGLYFVSYEILTNEYKRRFNRPNVDLIPAIIAGGLAGIFYWIGGMPADVLKSRLQSANAATFFGIELANAVFRQLAPDF
ncbi:GH13282 [Drosophila grimshawi]|uniref:GH13282 n=1 Tax=Drosophila grimshawi TaxID=7222 RepID=B4JQ33_DROGR|nr:GH13282 [Drosophila grimshawi]